MRPEMSHARVNLASGIRPISDGDDMLRVDDDRIEATILMHSSVNHVCFSFLLRCESDILGNEDALIEAVNLTHSHTSQHDLFAVRAWAEGDFIAGDACDDRRFQL